MTSTKLAINNRSVFVSLKPKVEKVYIPPFKWNNKVKAYFARLDKGKSSDVDAEISKPKSKPTDKFMKKSVLCLLVTFVVLLVILDQIVLC